MRIQTQDMNNPEQQNNVKMDKSIGILELFGKDTLESIQKKISNVTGLGVITSDFKGTPLTEMTAFCSFCKCIRKKSEQLLICNLSDAFGIAQSAVTKNACIYRCPCGLMEVAIPIIIDGQFLGGFLAGQVKCPDAPDDITSFNSIIQNISFDEREEQLFNEIPEMEYSKFYDIAQLVFHIINLLAKASLNQVQSNSITSEENASLRAQIHQLEYKNSLLQQELKKIKMFSHPILTQYLINTMANMAIMEDAYETNKLLLTYDDFMKYLYENKAEIVSLNTELEITEYYFRLFTYSKKEVIQMKYNIKKEYMHQQIPTFLLIHLIEKSIFPHAEGIYATLMLEINAWNDKKYFYLEIISTYELSHNISISEASKREDGPVYVYNSMEEADKKLRFFFGDNYELKEIQVSDTESKMILKYPMYFQDY